MMSVNGPSIPAAGSYLVIGHTDREVRRQQPLAGLSCRWIALMGIVEHLRQRRDRAPVRGVRAACFCARCRDPARVVRRPLPGSLTIGSSFKGAMVFQCRVAGALNRPFIVQL